MKPSIYDYDRRLESAIKGLKSAEDIPGQNRDAILAFVDESLSIGLTKARVSKYIYYLIRLSGWLGKPFQEADKADIKKVTREIELSKYVDFTKAEYRMLLRKFYKWLRQTEEFPEEVKWIRPRMKKVSKVKMPEELLTEDDIMSIVRASPNERNKAFIATLYESGCRVGELLVLRIKHISFDEYGGLINVDGKTGPRRIRLISCVPYLQIWLNKHPSPDNPESFVWVTTSGGLLKYSQLLAILRHSGKRAGIKKRIFPHLFRHSRATYLANHLTEAQMKEFFGWVQASDMAGIYVHMSGRDVDGALLRVYGLQKKDNPHESTLKTQVCSRCQAANPYTNTFCTRCGLALNEASRLEVLQQQSQRKLADEVLDKLLEDAEFKQFLLKKLEGLRKQAP